MMSPLRHMIFGVVLGLTATAAQSCRLNPTNTPDVVQSSVVESGGARAWYSDLTDRYGHGVLGDALEPTTLHLLTDDTSAQCGLRITLDAAHVFEDIAPRLVDLTGDATPELITVRSHARKGAQLAVYGQVGQRLELIAKTPYIGTRNRWLAPVGAADLDGDGVIEIAYIDRPHLAKTLRIWQFETSDNGAAGLREIATLKGLTNHRIGEDFISGGLRSCNGTPELVVADANWQRIIAVTLSDDGPSTKVLGPFSASAMTKALSCS